MSNLEVIHYPNLKTVLMVEDVLKKANQLMTREEIKKKLPRIVIFIGEIIVERSLEILRVKILDVIQMEME